MLAGDTLATAPLLDLGSGNVARVSDVIATASDVDLYALQLAPGDIVQLDIDASDIGSGLDSYLRVFDNTGQQIAANDDFDATDSKLTFQAARTATYFIGVSSAGNELYDPRVPPGAIPADLKFTHGNYNLTVTRTATGAAPAADLVGGYLVVVPEVVDPEDTTTPIAVRYRVENRGAVAAGSFVIEFRLTSDRAIQVLTTTLFPGQGSIVAGRIEVNGLQAGAALTDEITFTLPGAFPIIRLFVGMNIDADNQEPELNETNNASSARNNRDELRLTPLTGAGPAAGLSYWQDPVASVAADFNGDGIIDLAYLGSLDRSPLQDRNLPRPVPLVLAHSATIQR